MKCVDLYSGGGGLSIGFQRAGFSTTGYEHDPEIVAVANQNQLPTICQDLGVNQLICDADIIVGGPPCQPFSEASKMKKEREYEHDKRNGVDVFVHIVLANRPKAFLMEQSPNLVRNRLPYWKTLLSKLEEYYVIEDGVVNMTYFNVPQKRKRYICIGFRKDMNIPPSGILDPASSCITLVRTVLPRIERGMGPFLQEKTLRRIMKYEQRTGKHARTLRPCDTARTVTITNTMSKPGSNDCMRFAFDTNGKVVDRKILIADNVTYTQRKITFEEACMLQTFPSTYRWSGREKVRYTILGNAVPPAFATVLAQRMAKKMS